MPKEQKQKIATRKKFNPFYIVVIAVVFAIGHAFFVTYPDYQETQFVKDQTKDLEDQKLIKDKELEKAKEQAANLTPTDEELLRQSQIPEQVDIASLLRYLEEVTPFNTTELQKIDLKSINLTKVVVSKKESRKQKAQELKISLSLVSSPAAFRSFLQELERSDKRIFSISDISMTEIATGPLSKRGKYNLTMIAYNQK